MGCKKRSGVFLTLALGLAMGGLFSCSTVRSLIRASDSPLGKEIQRALPVPTEVRQGVALAKKYSKKYLKYMDGGELEANDVLDILSDTGVMGVAPRTRARSGPLRKGAPIAAPVQTYAGQYRWPTDTGVVSSEYGARWGKKHEGIDIAADTGVPVKAAADGVVIYAGSGLRGYGNVIIIRHDDRMTTLYGHNSKLNSVEGQRVMAGQTVALLGSSGRSTGPHLHFEIRDGERHLNPREKLGSSPYARFELLLDARNQLALRIDDPGLTSAH